MTWHDYAGVMSVLCTPLQKVTKTFSVKTSYQLLNTNSHCDDDIIGG